MNTPFPEFLRGVKPGESPENGLCGRVILFEFPYDELYPDLRVRDWKVRNGIPQNCGVIIKALYWEGKKYSHWTKHPKRRVWTGNETAFADVDAAMVFPDFRRYKLWSGREAAKLAANRELFDRRRPVIYPVIYRANDLRGARPTGEILVILHRTES